MIDRFYKESAFKEWLVSKYIKKSEVDWNPARLFCSNPQTGI